MLHIGEGLLSEGGRPTVYMLRTSLLIKYYSSQQILKVVVCM